MGLVAVNDEDDDKLLLLIINDCFDVWSFSLKSLSSNDGECCTLVDDSAKVVVIGGYRSKMDVGGIDDNILGSKMGDLTRLLLWLCELLR